MFIILPPWWWKQQIPPKRYYLSTRLSGVTSKIVITFLFTFFYLDGGGSGFLRNSGIFLPDYTVSHLTRPPVSISAQWETRISYPQSQVTKRGIFLSLSALNVDHPMWGDVIPGVANLMEEKSLCVQRDLCHGDFCSYGVLITKYWVGSYSGDYDK
jgi:hypothetical protein